MEKLVPLGFIYYLQNPTTAEIFYVGSTEVSLKNRLRTHYHHLREILKGKRLWNRRCEYLANLLPNKATIHLLEIVVDGSLDEREKYYIKLFKKLNPKLTNMTSGGKGGWVSEQYTDEQKAVYGHKISSKLKGVKKPKSFAENLSKQRKGLGNPAAKEIKIGWLVADKKYLFKYGFEVNTFCKTVNAYSNVYRNFKIGERNPYGYHWELFSDLSKEIQDIVQSSYESNWYTARQ